MLTLFLGMLFPIKSVDQYGNPITFGKSHIIIAKNN
jgi:hypothetical protein